MQRMEGQFLSQFPSQIPFADRLLLQPHCFPQLSRALEHHSALSSRELARFALLVLRLLHGTDLVQKKAAVSVQWLAHRFDGLELGAKSKRRIFDLSFGPCVGRSPYAKIDPLLRLQAVDLIDR